jgi:hypothetical protein
MHTQTTQETYRQLNKNNRRQGNIGEDPRVVQSKALYVACAGAKKGGRLVLGYGVTRFGVVLTIAIAIGDKIMHSPSLDALSVGMGVVSAAAFLIEWSTKRHACIGYDERELTALANSGHEGALTGKWGDLD